MDVKKNDKTYNVVNKMLRPQSFVSLPFHLGFHFLMISTQMVNVVTELMQPAK